MAIEGLLDIFRVPLSAAHDIGWWKGAAIGFVFGLIVAGVIKR